MSSETKNLILKKAGQFLLDRQDEILSANRKDLACLGQNSKDSTQAFRDRLLLNSARLQEMVLTLEQLACLPDPTGEIVEQRNLLNGLKIKKIRSSLGLIFLIFESRPNVAVEAFGLAIKSGNVILLKGGQESAKTTRALYRILGSACKSAELPEHLFWGIESSDRAVTRFLLKQSQLIDVVVPRGGPGLINFVTKNSSIPVIKNDRGLCHIYVHEDANLKQSCQIILNAKTQRPGVCNAMETLLIHRKIAPKALFQVHALLKPFRVQWKCCPISYPILKPNGDVKRALPSDWDREYLELILNCRVVDSLDQAIEHIDLHGSKHSEAILTRSPQAARKFQTEVDAAVVYWNASTRFTDGYAVGLGGELGISTQKLHVRGPVGLRELTCTRWIVEGQGQVRS